MKWLLGIMVWLTLVAKVEATSLVVLQAPTATDAGQAFEVEVEFSTSVKNTNYYLLGSFSQSEGSNSFGKTKNQLGEWVDSIASASSYFSITTDDLGHWRGNMSVMANTDDAGFKGQGDYWFKVNRYTGKSSNPAESSSLVAVRLLYTPPATPTPTPTTASTASPVPTPTPTPTLTPTATPTPRSSTTPLPTVSSKSVKTKPRKAEVNFFELSSSATCSSQSASNSGHILGTSVNLSRTDYIPILLMVGGVCLTGGLISLVLKVWPN